MNTPLAHDSIRTPRRRARDVALFLGAAGALAALFSVRGDVVHPRGDDPAHPLGHYAALWHAGHVPGGVLLGAVLVLAAVVGLLGLLGDSPLDLRGDEAAALPGAPRAWYRREGLWLVGFCVLLYVPLAGAYGLWDPWETHYAEVAREVLARDDWITLWWGQEGWFMSKPVLVFWMSALGMGLGSAFGLPIFADSGPGAHEWFVRLPVVLVAVAAVYALYRAVAHAWGRRAGLCCGLVLATTPYWFFLSHQAMTDMPFVAPLTIAMAFLMLAVTSDPEARVAARRVGAGRVALRVSHWHLAVGAIAAIALPQIVYLLTRPVTVACPEGAARAACAAALAASRLGPLQFPVERYAYGSAGNSAPDDLAASVPGSPAWQDRFNQVPFATSWVQAVGWALLALALFASLRRERRTQALAFAMVYLFGAVAFLGKGPAGLGVPEATLVGFLLVTARWRLVRQLRLAQGAAIFALVGLPWYVAVYCRLGREFTDRFVVNDLLNRAFAGVHGDTGTVGYYVAQLGYGMFPWSGLAPLALFGTGLYVRAHATEAQRDVVRIAALWFAAAFTLFSLMVTRFHHYIFPAVPALAVLVGLLLNRLLGVSWTRALGGARGALVGAATVAGVALLALGVARALGSVRGLVTEGAAQGHPAQGAVIVLAGAALLAGAGWSLARWRRPPTRRAADARAVGLGAAGFFAAVLLALVARDLVARASGPDAMPGAARLEQLFTYNYHRAFPREDFDYRPALAGFAAAAVLLAALLAVRPARALAARATVALAALFALWGLDVYVPDLSRHFSQRALIARYYAERARSGPGDPAAAPRPPPLVAFQMNWKGENFYTGNRAAMLECGLPFCEANRTADWLARHRGERVFALTTHGAAASFVAAVARQGGRAWRLTDARDHAMFVLLEARP